MALDVMSADSRESCFECVDMELFNDLVDLRKRTIRPYALGGDHY
jgi:hypothetical protein